MNLSFRKCLFSSIRLSVSWQDEIWNWLFAPQFSSSSFSALIPIIPHNTFGARKIHKRNTVRFLKNGQKTDTRTLHNTKFYSLFNKVFKRYNISAILQAEKLIINVKVAVAVEKTVFTHTYCTHASTLFDTFCSTFFRFLSQKFHLDLSYYSTEGKKAWTTKTVCFGIFCRCCCLVKNACCRFLFCLLSLRLFCHTMRENNKDFWVEIEIAPKNVQALLGADPFSLKNGLFKVFRTSLWLFPCLIEFE